MDRSTLKLTELTDAILSQMDASGFMESTRGFYVTLFRRLCRMAKERGDNYYTIDIFSLSIFTVDYQTHHDLSRGKTFSDQNMTYLSPSRLLIIGRDPVSLHMSSHGLQYLFILRCSQTALRAGYDGMGAARVKARHNPAVPVCAHRILRLVPIPVGTKQVYK